MDSNLPDSFGYYWVTKQDGSVELIFLCPPKYYTETEEVEAWQCPGIGRDRLDSKRMPRWKWIKIPKPEF